ncbi:GNAT family N-acetyltransferase [Plantactinospora sp. GCM10030261]|uniref:GNAT family N-acetyltransferase n=1 Tax=Plantactinospora sp. GCM10030261 TaxID=3273420 RepID=UPI0036213B27
MRIRRAESTDAAALAEVHVRSWQATYRGLVPQDYLDGLDPADRVDGWARIVASADWPRQGTLVAESDGRGVVGFAAFGPDRGDDTVDNNHTGPDRDAGAVDNNRAGHGATTDAGRQPPTVTGELFAIYALPEVWGTGMGRALVAETLRTMDEAGYREAVLWVLDGNRRARRFYAVGGWVADGTTRTDDDRGFPMNEVRYRHPLIPR